MHLNSNQIVTIDPKAFWISVSNNTSVHSSIVDLHLERNQIKYITSGTFDPLINLINLNVMNNSIGHIDNNLIINLQKLHSFSIRNNRLTALPTKWLPSNITKLFIDTNKIAYLSNNTFEGALTLDTIGFSIYNANDKVNIEYNTFSRLPTLYNIKVYPYNDYICDCNFIWYLNSKSTDKVCDNSRNKYANVRDYLKGECELPSPGYLNPILYLIHN